MSHTDSLPHRGMAFWHPSPTHAWLLRAASGPEPEAASAWSHFERSSSFESPLDPVTMSMLPLVHRRRAMLGVGEPWATHARNSHLVTWARNREQLSSAMTVVAALDRAGIPNMLLKGSALTVDHYADVGARPMSDIDIMVPPPHAGPAAGVLTHLGWTAAGAAGPVELSASLPVLHAWHFDGRSAPNIDLHWFPSYHCCADGLTDLFFSGSRLSRCLGRAVRVPSPVDLLFAGCVHGVHWNDPPAVRWIADALEILSHHPDPGWQRILELAALSRQRSVMAEALICLRECFGAQVPMELITELRSSAPLWERHELRLRLDRHPLGVGAAILYHGYRYHRWRSSRRDRGLGAGLTPVGYSMRLGHTNGLRGLAAFAAEKVSRRVRAQS